MSNDLRHAIVGPELSRSEWESVNSHTLQDGVVGSVLAFTGFGLQGVAPGAAGHVLTSQGPTSLPIWQAPSTELPPSSNVAGSILYSTGGSPSIASTTTGPDNALLVSHGTGAPSWTAAPGVVGTALISNGPASVASWQEIIPDAYNEPGAVVVSTGNNYPFFAASPPPTAAAQLLIGRVGLAPVWNIPGASGTVLTSSGVGAEPTWQAPSGVSITDPVTNGLVMWNGTSFVGIPQGSVGQVLQQTSSSSYGWTNLGTAATGIINGAAGTNRSLFYQSTGINRWEIRVNSTTEAGSNAGSDLQIIRYDDAGVAIATQNILANRASGVWEHVTNPTGNTQFNILARNATTAGSSGFAITNDTGSLIKIAMVYYNTIASASPNFAVSTNTNNTVELYSSVSMYMGTNSAGIGSTFSLSVKGIERIRILQAGPASILDQASNVHVLLLQQTVATGRTVLRLHDSAQSIWADWRVYNPSYVGNNFLGGTGAGTIELVSSTHLYIGTVASSNGSIFFGTNGSSHLSMDAVTGYLGHRLTGNEYRSFYTLNTDATAGAGFLVYAQDGTSIKTVWRYMNSSASGFGNFGQALANTTEMYAASKLYIGTSTADNLYLGTNSQFRFNMDSNGALILVNAATGITDSLSVRNTLAAQFTAISIYNHDTSKFISQYVYSASYAGNNGFGTAGANTVEISANTTFFFGTRTNNYVSIYQNSVQRFLVHTDGATYMYSTGTTSNTFIVQNTVSTWLSDIKVSSQNASKYHLTRIYNDSYVGNNSFGVAAAGTIEVLGVGADIYIGGYTGRAMFLCANSARIATVGTAGVYPTTHNTHSSGINGLAWSDVWCVRAAFNGSHSSLKDEWKILARGEALNIARTTPVGTFKYKPVGKDDIVSTWQRVGILSDHAHKLLSPDNYYVNAQDTACVALAATADLYEELESLRAEVAALRKRV